MDSYLRHIRALMRQYRYDEVGQIFRDVSFSANLNEQPRFSNTICLSIYTDGGALSKSSTIQFWPIIATIQGLPPKVQKSMDKTIYIATM